MHCPNCNQHYDNGKFCAECGVPLVDDAPTPSGAAFGVGDYAAIEGGIHVDSHNTINNIVQERQKHKEELHQDKVVRFKQLCEQIYEDGVMTIDESRQLENLRLTLGLDSVEADQIREQVRHMRLRQSHGELNPVVRISMQQIVSMAMSGNIELLKRSFPRLEAMAEKYASDEVQFNYYLLLAGLDPRKCVKSYETRKSDNYWQSFWTYLAYQNLDQLDKAQLLLVEMEAWQNRPFGNMALLACVGSLYTYWDDISQTDILEQAKMFIEQGADGFSSDLDRFAQSLMLLVQDNEEDLEKYQGDFSFFFNYIFSGVMQKRKMAQVYDVIKPIPKIDPLTNN